MFIFGLTTHFRMKKIILFIILFASIKSSFSQTVSTLTGSPGQAGFNSTTVGLNAAQFTNPAGICIDTAGRIWVAEEGAHRIRLILIATDDVYTRSGYTADPFDVGAAGYINGAGVTSRYSAPFGIASDPLGTLYIADQTNHAIRRMDKFTNVGNAQWTHTYAGEGPGQQNIGGYKNGKDTNARFNNPMDVAVDSAFNVYVADAFNDCIRKITTSQDVTLLAGSPGFSGFQDGAAGSAQFFTPVAVEMLDGKTLLVADMTNARIRAINLTNGFVSTYAGTSSTGGDDGNVATATFRAPSGLAVDKFKNVFVSDGWDGQANTIRKISNGVVSTIAGKYQTFGTTDGQDTIARFYKPGHMTFSKDGTVIYLTDRENHSIRSIDLKPVADFNTASTTIPPNVEITFTNLSMNNPTSYLWEITPSANVTFTPGFGPTTANPKVQFSTLGTFTVKLTVTNSYGQDVETKTSYITVNSSGGQPIANFIANKTVGGVGEDFNFTDLSSNSPTSWLWEITPNNASFVNGTTSASKNPVMRFTQTGEYTIKLTATNTLGSGSVTKTKYITIWPAGVKRVTELPVKVYPVPVKDQLTIEVENATNTIALALHDMNGKVIYEDYVIHNNAKINIDLQDYPSGVYFLSMSDGTSKEVKKIIKE